MSVFDLALMILIAGGAIWLLYRSLWKKNGHCQECSSGTCHKK